MDSVARIIIPGARQRECGPASGKCRLCGHERIYVSAKSVEQDEVFVRCKHCGNEEWS